MNIRGIFLCIAFCGLKSNPNKTKTVLRQPWQYWGLKKKKKRIVLREALEKYHSYHILTTAWMCSVNVMWICQSSSPVSDVSDLAWGCHRHGSVQIGMVHHKGRKNGLRQFKINIPSLKLLSSSPTRLHTIRNTIIILYLFPEIPQTDRQSGSFVTEFQILCWPLWIGTGNTWILLPSSKSWLPKVTLGC